MDAAKALESALLLVLHAVEVVEVAVDAAALAAHLEIAAMTRKSSFTKAFLYKLCKRIDSRELVGVGSNS